MKIFRNVISPGYLPLMHIPILEGRNFTEQDNENAKAPLVMIVNQAFVRRFFAGRDPVGKNGARLGKLVPHRRRRRRTANTITWANPRRPISTCPSARSTAPT